MTLPIPSNIKQYATTVDNSAEVIDKILWDSGTYAAAGTQFLDFFQSLPTSILNGNLDQAGMVGGNRPFLIRQIGVKVQSRVADDVMRLIHHGFFRLYVGNKGYGDWPISFLPPGGGVTGIATGAALVERAQFGVADPRACYSLVKPLLLSPNLNFRVRLEWPGAPVISGPTAIRVLLKGEMVRYIQ